VGLAPRGRGFPVAGAVFGGLAFGLVDQIAGPLRLGCGGDHEPGVVVQRGQPAAGLSRVGEKKTSGGVTF